MPVPCPCPAGIDRCANPYSVHLVDAILSGLFGATNPAAHGAFVDGCHRHCNGLPRKPLSTDGGQCIDRYVARPECMHAPVHVYSNTSIYLFISCCCVSCCLLWLGSCNTGTIAGGNVTGISVNGTTWLQALNNWYVGTAMEKDVASEWKLASSTHTKWLTMQNAPGYPCASCCSGDGDRS